MTHSWLMKLLPEGAAVGLGADHGVCGFALEGFFELGHVAERAEDAVFAGWMGIDGAGGAGGFGAPKAPRHWASARKNC